MFGFFKKKPKTMLEDLGICADNIAKAGKNKDPLAALIGIPSQITGAINAAREVYGLDLAERSILSVYFDALGREDFAQKSEMESKIIAKINLQVTLEEKGRLFVYLMTGKKIA